MNAVGFIVEYNPFHNGHAWHLTTAKQLSGCKYSVGIMSGNFMQRGEPALFDKWKRAEMAVRGGVDLVIELPVVFTVRSAQYFAGNGIRLLQALGIVSHVCFGSECAKLDTLKTIANAIEDPQVTNDLQQNLKTGIPYAAALSKAIQNNYYIDNKILAAPNTILAVEYLRAITKYAPKLIPLPIPRMYNHYHDTSITNPIASATAIRQALSNHSALTADIQTAVPATTAHIIKQILHENRGPADINNLSTLMLAKLRTAHLDWLKELPDAGEGLHYKIKECALQAANLQQLLTMLKSKRYPHTRLQRILTHAILDTTQAQITKCDQTGPLYIRILAFNQHGRHLIKTIEQKSNLPLVTKTTYFLNSKERDKLGTDPLKNMLARDTLASDIYVLALPTSRWQIGGWDFRQSPLYIPS